MRDELQAHGYGNDTAQAQTVALNAAYRDILGERRWPFLLQQMIVPGGLAAGANKAFVAGLDSTPLDAVRLLPDGSDPGFLPLEQLRSQQSPTVAGRPRYWSQAGGTVEFERSADRAYDLVLDVVQYPADLQEDSDEPIFPAVYHSAIVYGAIKPIAIRERDTATYQLMAAEYERLLQRMRVALGLRQRQSSSHVAKSGYWG